MTCAAQVVCFSHVAGMIDLPPVRVYVGVVHNELTWDCVPVQVAVLLAPVAFVTHMDSLPMNALAALDTDEVGGQMGWAHADCTLVVMT